MKLKECYSKMNGDYEDVMSRLPREKSVIKFLRRFAENTEFSELLEEADKKNYQRVFELSHDLKGMAANLGIKGFAGLVSQVCEETRNKEPGEGFAELLDKTDREYRLVIETISVLEDE